MRTIKKQISVLLAVLMIISSVMTVSFSVSAAETTGGTITVKSNLCDSSVYNYTANDKQIQVTYYLQCDNKILNMQGGVYYDSSVLKVADTNTLETSIPGFTSGSSFVNFDLTNKALFNSTSLHLYDFTSKGVFFTVVFDIIGSGDTEVNLDVEVITATTANSYSELKDASDIDLVYYDNIMADKFVFSSESKLIKDEKAVTLKFAAPTSKINRYKWTAPMLYYGSSTTMSSNTQIAMTATDEVYYTADTGSSTIISAGGWTVFSVTLTPEQVAEVESARLAGFTTADGVSRTTLTSKSNVFKACVDTYSSTYNTDATSLSALDGYTFIIKDAMSGATSYTSYGGYWVSDFTTVKFAAPSSNTKRSTWDNVQFYYAASGVAFDAATKLTMVNTYETTKVSDIGNMTTLKAGRWYIYAVSLDAVQTAEANASAKAGFAKPGADNKTSFSKSVLKAKTDVYDGTYNTTARTLEELEGQVFVVQARATATSLLTFLGEWQTEAKYTEGKDDTITIYFAAPKGVSATADWSTGAELYYGNTTSYKNTNRLAMTKTNTTTTVDVAGSKLTTLASGDWDVYELTLTAEQIIEIDNSNNVGFIKTGSYNRTSILQTKNICRASRIYGETAYASAPETIEAFDGLTFVINGMSDAANERTSYLGSWVA